MVFALAGNQNCGKTTLFNLLTGSNQHVGNFPGVTVERKSGEIKGYNDCTVVDLPGIYSIRPYSDDERVARDFLLGGEPDVIINIVSATNPERNLYLTLQLLRLGIPMVVALNMMDEVRECGGSVDADALGQLLGVKAVPISATDEEGVEELLSAAFEAAKSQKKPDPRRICENKDVAQALETVAALVHDDALVHGLTPEYAAEALVTGDSALEKALGLSERTLASIESTVQTMETRRGLDRNAAIADMRYAYIAKICEKAVIKCGQSKTRRRSMRIDALLTSKYLAFPAFAAIMLLSFWLTFDVIGSALGNLLSLAIDRLSEITSAFLLANNASCFLSSLITDGIFAGVGGVLSFLPVIITLFLFLSVLEDTGYMARVAFIMDKPMRKLGLSGRSVVPMLMGFGCSVPAVMASRTLSSDRDRKLTVLLVPFMSCPAKIPVYAAFASAFFPGYGAVIMTSLYLLGVLAAILAAKLLGKTAFNGEPSPFLLELPDYRFPTLRNTALLLREKVKDFLGRVFGIVFIASMLIWFLGSFDARFAITETPSESLLADVGRMLTPIFRPLGFGDWRAVTALAAGLGAKEVVASTLAVLAGAGSTLEAALSSMFTPLSAISFLVFVLLYTPCAAAMGVIRRELGSSFSALAAGLFQFAAAWFAAFIIYRIGGFLAFGQIGGFTMSAFDYILIAVLLAAASLALRVFRRNGSCGACSDCSGCPNAECVRRHANDHSRGRGKLPRNNLYAAARAGKGSLNRRVQPYGLLKTDRKRHDEAAS